jgi:hypothetical protein
MDRRDFLGTAAALTATAAYGSVAPLPRRLYKNGIDLSIIALGGIVVCGLSQKEASRRVAEAYDRGVRSCGDVSCGQEGGQSPASWFLGP